MQSTLYALLRDLRLRPSGCGRESLCIGRCRFPTESVGAGLCWCAAIAPDMALAVFDLRLNEAVSFSLDRSDLSAAIWFDSLEGEYRWRDGVIRLAPETVYLSPEHGAGSVMLLPGARQRGMLLLFDEKRLSGEDRLRLSGLFLPQLHEVFRAMEICPGGLAAEAAETRFRALIRRAFTTCRKASEGRFDSLDAHAVKPKDREQIRLLTAYLRSHVGEDTPLPELERMIGVKPSKLRYVFKAVTGQTLRDYRAELKLERAKALLRETEDSIAEISDQLGFADPSGFSRFFCQKAGVTPAAYRRRNAASEQSRNEVLQNQ